MTDALSDAPRWRGFTDRETPCPCRGRVFHGVFDIAYDHPDPWPHGNRAAHGSDVLEVGADRLTSDLCTRGEHRFIRPVLPLPINGSEGVLSFGPWGGVNPESFGRYVHAIATGDWSGF